MKQIFKNNLYQIVFISLLLIITSTGCGRKKTDIQKGHSKYYVSLEGNDNNSGEYRSPFRTVKKGVSMLKAGDTLMVASGNYGYEYDINILTSGTKKAPIVIMTEKPGSVILKGPRKKGEEDYRGDGGAAFSIINHSNIVLDGFYISDYAEGVKLNGLSNSKTNPHNVLVQNCIFNNNGEVGVQCSRVDSVIIKNCQFISDKIQKKGYIVAVQDYGCNFYYCNNALIENCYFYGAHHQSLSFKEGDKNCTARRNIFEGAQYTAIYLGQNKRFDARPDNDNPTCENLIAEFNIVRPAKGFRVKSPLRVENCNNAIVRYNYFEGFDETAKTGGINIWNEALGKIEIYDNILAFGVKNRYSAGILLQMGQADETDISIRNNTFYDIEQDLLTERYRGDKTEGFSFEKNISYKCKYYKKDDRKNFRGNPHFVSGDPLQLPIASKPKKPNFELYYNKLTLPFRLSKNSNAKGYGVQFKEHSFAK